MESWCFTLCLTQARSENSAEETFGGEDSEGLDGEGCCPALRMH